MNVTFEIDHILPETAGGLTVNGNLAFSCPLCNTYKGAQTRGRDHQSGRDFPLFHPRTEKLEPALSWAQNEQIIEGRTRTGRATIDALQLNNLNLLRLRTIWLAIGSAPPTWQTPPLMRL